jgi:hypothetical protein
MVNANRKILIADDSEDTVYMLETYLSSKYNLELIQRSMAMMPSKRSSGLVRVCRCSTSNCPA